MISPFSNNRYLNLRFVLCIILTCVACCVNTPAVQAQETTPQPVRVGYYEQEVFEEGAQDGAVKKGYAYDYYRKLSEYTGWSYEYVYGDFTHLYEDLIAGKIDLLAGLAYKEERTRQLSYPKLPMGSETYNLVKHDTDTSITTNPSTLANKHIGVLDSALVDVLNAYLREHDVIADVQTFQSNAELFRSFDEGQVDVLAAEGDGAYGREHTEVIGSFGSSDYYLCVSHSRPDLLDELNTAQAELDAEEPDYMSILRARYYGSSVSSRAFSEEERTWLATHDTLTVGYLDDFLPYSDLTNGGSNTGLVQHLIPEMLQSMGISDLEVIYKSFASYDSMVAAVNDGAVDVVFPIGGSPYFSEENGIYQSRPVVTTVIDLVYKGEYSDEKLAHIAVNENNRVQDHFVRTYYPDAQIVSCSTIEECLNAVVSGRADSTTVDLLRATQLLKNRTYRGLTALPLSNTDDRCFGIRIGDEGLLRLLNRGLSMLGDDYALNQVHRYDEGLYSYTILDTLLDNMMIFGTAALVLAALVIALLMRDSRRSRRQKNELARALVAAESANRAKTAFLNNMSHDIRTPLNAIVGFTALAASNIDDTAQVQDYLDKVTVSSHHLLSLVNDVLDMSHIESGKMVIEEAEVHMSDLIEDVQVIVQSDAAEKHQTFLVDTQEIVHDDVYTDRLRLNQVLLNILSNAIKFTPPEGTISLHITEIPTDAPDRASFEFRITDNGMGMSEEFQRTIFEPFTRAQTSTVSGIQGTGLGMTITKNIVDMMGGTIEVHSKEHEGTQFVVCIPCRIAQQPTTSQPSPEQGRFDFCGKRVLLVEDNELNMQIAHEILSAMGLEVEGVYDGTEAVTRMEEVEDGRYDLILMDIQMPQMDGYEATRHIRALDDTSKASIPIIAVTANAFAEDREMAMDAGMNDFLTKPYDVPQIMETLARHLC